MTQPDEQTAYKMMSPIKSRGRSSNDMLPLVHCQRLQLLVSMPRGRCKGRELLVGYYSLRSKLNIGDIQSELEVQLYEQPVTQGEIHIETHTLLLPIPMFSKAPGHTGL
jgi:hypothetical protein